MYLAACVKRYYPQNSKLELNFTSPNHSFMISTCAVFSCQSCNQYAPRTMLHWSSSWLPPARLTLKFLSFVNLCHTVWKHVSDVAEGAPNHYWCKALVYCLSSRPYYLFALMQIYSTWTSPKYSIIILFHHKYTTISTSKWNCQVSCYIGVPDKQHKTRPCVRRHNWATDMTLP